MIPFPNGRRLWFTLFLVKPARWLSDCHSHKSTVRCKLYERNSFHGMLRLIWCFGEPGSNISLSDMIGMGHFLTVCKNCGDDAVNVDCFDQLCPRWCLGQNSKRNIPPLFIQHTLCLSNESMPIFHVRVFLWGWLKRLRVLWWKRDHQWNVDFHSETKWLQWPALSVCFARMGWALLFDGVWEVWIVKHCHAVGCCLEMYGLTEWMNWAVVTQITTLLVPWECGCRWRGHYIEWSGLLCFDSLWWV